MKQPTRVQAAAGIGGCVVISLDTELAWGRLGDPRLPSFFPLYERTPAVIDRVLGVFDKHSVPATWAFVAALLDPEADIPAGETRRLGCWQGQEILRRVLDSRVPHEVASHSYSHSLFDRLPRKGAEDELARVVRLAEQNDLSMSSFVFPKNRVAHLDVVSEFGFSCFRGPDRVWYRTLPALTHKAARLVDTIVPGTPSVSQPERTPEGLVAVDGQLPFYRPPFGYKRRLSMRSLTRRAMRGLEAASRHKAVFHLWFHPHDFAYRSEEHLSALDDLLRLAASMRDRGQLEIATMKQIADRYREPVRNPHPQSRAGEPE